MSARSEHYITKQAKFAGLFNVHCDMIRNDYSELDSEERDFEDERSDHFADCLLGLTCLYLLEPHEIDVMTRLHYATNCSADVAYEHTQDIFNVLYRHHVDVITSRLGML